jgi:squalene-hopene/tetraprenyl-beta-curcumene cyclase
VSRSASPSIESELFDPTLRAHIHAAHEKAERALLEARDGSAHWTGELSASALSTATAVTALTLVSRRDPNTAPGLRAAIARGFDWLATHQNPDGGWGDTTRSFSNISTTTLCWAAFGLLEESTSSYKNTITAAERWLTHAAGSLEPDALVAAIEHRYGNDRTFSIPILTMSALCGRLGPDPTAWPRVRQLPFELAALPQAWFGALRLPVVSYALPALIAIGQARHAKSPTHNPILRWLRDRCRRRTLAKLTELQPVNGGFLEATPLTSFVVMSLTALPDTESTGKVARVSRPVIPSSTGRETRATTEANRDAGHVLLRGVEFLTASQRADGCWPIDTNLATWVTTLSVNALHSPASPSRALDEKARAAVRDWLLGQQYRQVHPYTLAAPGGWAWTDLPGGVPDADDTSGAILALTRLDSTASATREVMEAGVRWLLDLQNRDGGIPTFCRGWGRLPFDRSSPDITAHAVRAWTAAMPALSENTRSAVSHALPRAIEFLHRTQRVNGTWIPLWFGHQENADDENPLYGTTRVVLALFSVASAEHTPDNSALDRAVTWLIANQNTDGGWSGAPGAASSLEETGLALEALAAAHDCDWLPDATCAALIPVLRRGSTWLVEAIEQERWQTPAPIGFYFAKLWYFERLYPLIFAQAALARLAAIEPPSDADER